MNSITAWFQRYFSDPQVVFLTVSLAVLFLLIVFFGGTLAPVLASLILAYLLEGLVGAMERRHVPRPIGASLVIIGLVLVMLFVVLGLAPLLSKQVTQLFQQVPEMIKQGSALLMTLPEQYPNLFSRQQVEDILAGVGDDLGAVRQQIVQRTLSVGVGLLTALVYLVLMPVLVFFFLKDKDLILAWFGRFVPRDYALAARVWRDVDEQVGNFVRGKFWEVIIVWAGTTIVLAMLGLNYAILLGALVGLSVLIPYIGAALVTVPVALIAYFQWGWSSEMAWVVLAYGVIQFLDGNVLVPLLFSEVVNLHPVAIIVAILFFGGVWGFWGIFFAIPLATLVSALITAWPRPPAPEEEDAAEGEAGPAGNEGA